jgi:hypothetical protein
MYATKQSTQETTMIRFLSLLALACLVAAPSFATAKDFTPDPELRLSIAGASLRNTTPDRSFVSDNRGLNRFEMGFGYEFARNLLVGVEFSIGGSSTQNVEGWESYLNVATVGVRIRYMIEFARFFRPFITVGGGMVTAREQLNVSNATLPHRRQGYSIDAAGGFEIYTPGRVSVGFSTDSGYAYRSPLAFDEMTPDDNDGPQSSVDLGELSFRGFQWRGGVFLRTTF